MQGTVAFSALGLTLALVLARPRVGGARLSAAAGALPAVLLLFATGILRAGDALRAAEVLWRPLVTLASIMVTTSVSHHLGIFDRITRSIEIRTRGPVSPAFTTVYAVGAATAAVFNNDAAILLLTPIVVPVILRLYPRRPQLAVPFAFAVFMSAGVAPFCTSNPMNLVVAEQAGIGFNAYAARMLPVAAAGWLVSYAMLRLAFRKQLADAVPARGAEQGSLAPMETTPTRVLWVVTGMLLAYPVLSYFDAPVWVAAFAGAALVCALGLRARAITPAAIARGAAWDVLGFLLCIFLTALALENVGVTRAIARVYALAGGRPLQEVALVGGLSSIGSAVVNNHPMAMLNALSIGSLHGDPGWRILAALVGGDIGPRLLPTGSLAGLMWIEMVRKLGVDVSAREFVRVGVVVAVPTLAACLAVLALERAL